MRHVDEGTIHAWLDAQIADPAEMAWIDEHFRGCVECRARLAEERLAFDRAETLLAGATPSVERPPFDALVAKAARNASASEATSVAALTRGRNERWLIQAGWAASVAIAVGLGWTAREFTDRGTLNQTAAPRIAEPARVTPGPTPPAEAAHPFAEEVTGLQVARQRAAPAPRPAASDTRADSAAPVQERSAGTAVTETARAAALPAAPPPTSAPPPVTPSAPSAVRQEAVRIAAEGRPQTALNSEWGPLPRTEAAARTGMPLYGIDGVDPLLTAISADGTMVRTTYRLASGETVELLQQRAAPDSLADNQATTRGLAAPGGGGAVLGRVTSPGRTLSLVRGDVRLTLQTFSVGTDLDSLGSRLRID